MFSKTHVSSPAYRRAVIGLLLLSATSLVITVWTLVDFLEEQRIVQQLSRDLPARDLPIARSLAGELQWQFRLTILVLANSVATAIAIVLLWRAYQTGQASLRNLRALASDILNSVDQAVLTVDVDDMVTSVNHPAWQLLEIDPVSTVGKPLAGLTQQIDLVAFRDAASQHGHWDLVRDFAVQVGNQPRWLRGFCQPLRDEQGKHQGSVLQLRDVTQQVHIENQMLRMERFMGLGALAVGLHHEIKNPLAGLSLHVQLLEEQLETGDGDPAEVRELLQVTKTEVTRIGNVLESFRDFASVANLQLAEVNMSELVQRQLQLIAPKARQQSVRIEYVATVQQLPVASVDRDRFEQVLLNLLLNALQAMPGGGTLHVTVEVVAAIGVRSLWVIVSDTGPGIPEYIAEHVFDPYFTTKSDGTGLGLAISDKIIRQHGGEIDFETSPAGTRFRIRLPLRNSCAA